MAKIVIALGGNALLRRGERGTIEEQKRNVMKVAGIIASLVERGYMPVITHGNGPQVGNLLLQNEAAKDVVPPMPLDVCVAETQGMLGYIIQQALNNEFMRRGIERDVVSVVTQVVVDRMDPSFTNPTKFVGPFYTKEEAERLIRRGYTIKKDSDRGWRRVVPSPKPLEILEARVIRLLVDMGVVVIASGGGGIPVVRGGEGVVGVEAVIDKDLAAALLAEAVGAERLVMLTDVDHAYINYGSPEAKPLGRVDTEVLRRYYEEGHFPPGSMGPKIEAAIRFVERTGGVAAIGDLNDALRVVELKSGTIVVKK